jgi:hypothetical protein
MPAVAGTTATVGTTATAGKSALAGEQIRSARKWYGWLSLDRQKDKKILLPFIFLF